MLKDKLNISTIDIDLYRDHIYNKDKIKSLDVNSRFKRFKFFYNGLLLNLENITVRAYIIKPDNKEIFNDLTIIDGNIAELEFTNQSLLVPGILKLELVLYEDDAELSSFLLEYEVIKSLRSDNSIESSNEYNSLQIALQKVELWNKNYQALYDKWNNDFNVLHANKSAILDNLKTTKENELNKLKIDKNNELETLHNTKESELNKLKSDKDNELTTLYNSKDEELTTLKNAWDEEFKKKYDGLNQEYSERVVTLEDDILNSNSSESLLNEDVTNFKAGTGSVDGVNKDYTEEMEQSLVILDDIQGRTEKLQTSGGQWVLKHQNISCLYTLDENDTQNYFIGATPVNYNGSTVTSELNGSNLSVTGNTTTYEILNVTYKVNDLVPGEVYALTVDSVDKQGTGVYSAVTYDSEHYIQQLSKETMFNEYRPSDEGCSMVFRAKESQLDVMFFVALGGVQNTNGTVSYKNIQLRKVKNYSQHNITLKGVPSGVCDKYKNRLITKLIDETVFNNENYKWLHETNTDVTQNVTAFRTLTGVPNFKFTEVHGDKLLSNMESKTHTEWGLDTKGVHVGNSDNLYAYFNVLRSEANDTQTFINKFLPSFMVYVSTDIKYEDYVLGIEASTGDIIYTDASFPFTFTHTVQLNTKSEIEELQKSFISEKKSIWSKIKELTNIKMNLDVNGYIKLPKLMGDILIQWGEVQNPIGTSEVRVNLPVAFSDRFYTVQLTGQWNNSHDHYWSMSATDYKTFITPMKHGNYEVSDNVYWLLIGR